MRAQCVALALIAIRALNNALSCLPITHSFRSTKLRNSFVADVADPRQSVRRICEIFHGGHRSASKIPYHGSRTLNMTIAKQLISITQLVTSHASCDMNNLDGIESTVVVELSRSQLSSLTRARARAHISSSARPS